MLTESKIKPQSKSDIGFEKRDVFSKKFDYETFTFALCFRCAYFAFSNTKGNTEWAGNNGSGTDINGNPAKKLPDFVRLEKTEGGVSVVLTA